MARSLCYRFCQCSASFLSTVQILVHSNCLSERIRVLEGEVEDISCPDMVDIIVSEPMGYMLLSDRLMGSFLHARKWLKPNGRSAVSRIRMWMLVQFFMLKSWENILIFNFKIQHKLHGQKTIRSNYTTLSFCFCFSFFVVSLFLIFSFLRLEYQYTAESWGSFSVSVDKCSVQE